MYPLYRYQEFRNREHHLALVYLALVYLALVYLALVYRICLCYVELKLYNSCSYTNVLSGAVQSPKCLDIDGGVLSDIANNIIYNCIIILKSEANSCKQSTHLRQYRLTCVYLITN